MKQTAQQLLKELKAYETELQKTLPKREGYKNSVLFFVSEFHILTAEQFKSKYNEELYYSIREYHMLNVRYNSALYSRCGF